LTPVSNDSVITVSMYGTAVKTVAVKNQLGGYETGKVPKPIEPGKTGSIFNWLYFYLYYHKKVMSTIKCAFFIYSNTLLPWMDTS